MQRYVIHTCKRCRRTIRATVNVETIPETPREHAKYSVNGGLYSCTPPETQLAAICACGLRYRPKLIQATTSSRHVCDYRCMSATGPICNCSCNGANHGASYTSVFCTAVAVEDTGLFAAV